jgi:hypothetical protein
MRIHKITLAALLLAPSLALAQVHASAGIHFDLPMVLPQLVVISPGVQVVPEVRHEVFFVDGWYWARHDHGWYRSRHHRGGWVHVPGRGVPASLVKMKPGKYRNWKAPRPRPAPEPAHYRDHDRRHDGHDRWDDRHDRRDHDRDHDRHDGNHGKHGKKGGRH